MKDEAKVISIVFFLSAFLVVVSFGEQKAEWKGKREEENGIKVIKNPRDPLYGEIKFELEEDLSIGKEDDENFLFYKIADIQVDKDGNIYVVDFGNNRIQQFDFKGNYLQTIGREGEGPGEFVGPLRILFDKKTGNIYVRDGLSSIKIFDKHGNYLRAIRLECFPTDFELNEDGNILGICRILSRIPSGIQSHSLVFVKLNFEGKIEKKIAKYPYYRSRRTIGSITYGISHGYEYNSFMTKIDDQTFIYGYSKEYELNVVDKEGNLLYKIKKDEPKRKIPSEEKHRIEREATAKGVPIQAVKVKYPPYIPFIYAIYTDSAERIYIQRNQGKRTGQGPKEFDIFSKDGYCLYNTTFPYPAVLIKDGYFYTRVVNEDTGEEFVKRFMIKNWKQIKEGIS